MAVPPGDVPTDTQRRVDAAPLLVHSHAYPLDRRVEAMHELGHDRERARAG
jgi:hypothetical protein